MKPSQKGFSKPLLITLIAVIVVAGVLYFTRSYAPCQLFGNCIDVNHSTTNAPNTQTNVKGNTGPDYTPPATSEPSTTWVTATFMDYPNDLLVTPANPDRREGPTYTFPKYYFTGSNITSAKITTPSSCGSEAPNANVTVAGINFYRSPDGLRYVLRGACAQTFQLSIETNSTPDVNSQAYLGLQAYFDKMVISYAKKLPANSLQAPTGLEGNTDPRFASQSDWKTYSNSKYRFSIKYPKDFTTNESDDSGYFDETNLFEADLNAPSDYQKGTDFNIGSIRISVSPKTDNCYSLSSGGGVLSASKMINGIKFHYNPNQPFEDSAMGGQRGRDSLFTTIKNNQCYRVEKLIGYRVNIGAGNLDPEIQGIRLNLQQADADFDSVISTLVIK